jgi:hypothetical protein
MKVINDSRGVYMEFCQQVLSFKKLGEFNTLRAQ